MAFAQTIAVSLIVSFSPPLSSHVANRLQRESKQHRQEFHRLKSRQLLILEPFFQEQFVFILAFRVFSDPIVHLCADLYVNLFSYAMSMPDVVAILIISFAVITAASFYQTQFSCVVCLVSLSPLVAKDHTQAHHL